jgi:thiamine biosynthesis protein ThiI
MDTLLIHYSEIGTKGANRGVFERRLRDDIKKRLAPLDVTDVRVDNSRLIAPLAPGHDVARIRAELAQVFGIAWHAFARILPREETAIRAACVDLARTAATKGAKTFKVYVKRVDKTFPVPSEQLCRTLGGAVIDAVGLTVKMEDHDLGLFVEILPNKALVFTDKTEGLRGMPRGSSGRMLCLFSGGIDSPVAAWSMMRRGAQVDLLHFHPFPKNEDVLGTKITELLTALRAFNPKAVLHLMPHHHYQMTAALKVPVAYETVMFRRFMLLAAEAFAHTRRHAALITGDALGQVASQTLENMAAAQGGLALPVFQPLISMDKDDIIRAAQKIGTFDLSNKTYKDCCSLMSRKPKTTITVERARTLEKDLNLDALISPTLADAAMWDGETLRPIGRIQ